MGASELGQGVTETMLFLASQVLHVPIMQIKLHMGDTRYDPPGGMTTASRTTFVSGNALTLACEDLLAQIAALIASEFNLQPEQVSLQADRIVRRDNGQALLSLQELALHHPDPLVGRAVYDPPETAPLPERTAALGSNRETSQQLHFAYSYGAQAAIVSVHRESGDLKIHRIIAALDCGKALNRPGVEGQIEGGVIQALGYALSERFTMQNGYPSARTLSELGVPRLADLPPIVSIIVEVPHPHGPLGAKGMGEMPMNATPPAIANAIHDAVGVWINALPITPEKIRSALAAGRKNLSRTAT